MTTPEEYQEVISRGAPHELDGALVEVQCYQDKEKTRHYGPRGQWLCRKVWLTDDGVPHKYWLANPLRPNDESGMIYPTPDFCDVVRVPAEELGVLF